MTPDGISDDDWGCVHQCVLDIVNASSDENQEAHSAALAALGELLDDLQEKYGPLPSILATRADYSEDDAEREYWLLAAYSQARQHGDSKNLVLIAASLATFYVETKVALGEGRQWLATLEENLVHHYDEDEAEEAARLRAVLDQHGAGG